MGRALSIRNTLTVGLIGLSAGILLTAYARAEGWKQPETWSPADLLGSQLPAVTLQSLDGGSVALTDRLVPGPTMIIVLGPKDCFSCESYRLELNILKSKLPGISPVLIGSGAENLFKDYFRRDHLQSVGLLDPDHRLLTALRIQSAPLVLLVDSTGRILFVDNRSSSAAAQFPFGRLLPLLGGVLQPPPSSTSKTGAPN
jgi:hypothetical protein